MEKSSDICSDFQLNKCLYGRRFHQDRINSLPDDVLLLVLSFLSFKEVVKTSLLSRRWLNLWVQTPVLDFQAPLTVGFLISDTERRNYIEWVNSVLQRHKCQHLKEFKIVCQLDKSNEKDIETWLVYAFSRKVEHLELNLMVSRNGSIYVFDSRFLEFNNGKAISDGCEGRLLRFDFKCLKSMSLKRVDVTGDTINFILKNCPFLKHLEVVDNLKLVNLVISDPTLALKCLKIHFCHRLKVLSISNLSLVSLEVPSIHGLTLKNLPMLLELSIEGSVIPLSRFSSQASYFFSQLEAFTLICRALKNAALLCNTDKLTKLKRLVIDVILCDDESLTMLFPIIYSCPQLEEFVLKLQGSWMLKKTSATSRNIINYKVKIHGSPSSLQKSKSLKVFEFFGYYGLDRDVELIMDMAENVVGLKKIIIDLSEPYCGYKRSSKNKEETRLRNTIALQQYDSLRKSIPAHVDLLIRSDQSTMT